MGQRVVDIPLTDALFGSVREAPSAFRREVDTGREYNVVTTSRGTVGTCRVRSFDDKVLVLELRDDLVIGSGARLRPLFLTGSDGVTCLQSVSLA